MTNDESVNASSQSVDAGYETRDVNVLIIVVLALACVALVAIAAVGLNEYFLMTRDRIVQEQVLGKISPAMIELRQQEQRLVTEYGVVDAEKGIYRIPVDRAMELLIQQTPGK